MRKQFKIERPIPSWVTRRIKAISRLVSEEALMDLVFQIGVEEVEELCSPITTYIKNARKKVKHEQQAEPVAQDSGEMGEELSHGISDRDFEPYTEREERIDEPISIAAVGSGPRAEDAEADQLYNFETSGDIAGNGEI